MDYQKFKFIISAAEWLNVPADSMEIEEMLKRGPYIYELFSIMIHQGNATAGHYFAYIKYSFDILIN